MNRQISPTPDAESDGAPMSSILIRLFWMAFGGAALIGLGLAIWTRSSDTLLSWSLLYWLDVGLIVIARYVDIRYHEGLTVNLEPATFAHWRRHTAILVPVALALWAAAVWVPSP